eukprot:3733360-Amphidinium_carterae.1
MAVGGACLPSRLVSSIQFLRRYLILCNEFRGMILALPKGDGGHNCSCFTSQCTAIATEGSMMSK